MSYRINLFVEDHGHEAVLRALIDRLANQYSVTVTIIAKTSTGGHGQALKKLKDYISDLKDGREEIVDLLIVAIDGNCVGYVQRRQEIDKVMRGFSGQVIYAIPDPHIERWLLLDTAAFKSVFGKGCSAPNQKCDRDRYKRLLNEAIHKAGRTALLGGIEYAEDLVNAMDLEQLEHTGDSLSKFLKPLCQQLKGWQQASQQ